MKILVPTDFSTSSRKAIKYATFLAETLKAELILLHAVSDLSIWLEKEEQRTNAAAQAKLESLAQSIRKNYSERIKVSTFLVQQFPLNDVINNMAFKMKIDFVVIGSKGVTGAANKLIGSFAAGMIRHCNVPVIAVPESNKKKNVSGIVLPTDLLNISDEINTVVSFAKKFNAVIHVLFVSGKKGGALPLKR
jgi:nucleotide-binding universal stress UspA family protein